MFADFYAFTLFYFAKIYLKYNYSFDELKEAIYQLELRLERLKPSEIKTTVFNKEALLPKDFMKRQLIPIRSIILSIQFKAYYSDNKLYMDLFEEYFQRIKEYKKFTLILILGLLIIFMPCFTFSSLFN